MISFFTGFGLGLSFIVAIGAQNVYVLRQGVLREHVLAVVTICALSDAVLITAGVAGLGTLVEAAPWLVTTARWMGAVFLACYAALSARKALHGTQDSLHPATSREDTHRSTGITPVILTVLALTWLNPHVYIDTVLMLGSIAATHGDERWLFAGGAGLASIAWFAALGYGARHLTRWLSGEKAWRILDGIIAAIMISIAVSLILPVFTGS